MKYTEFDKKYSKLYEEQKIQEAIDVIKKANELLSKKEYEDNYVFILRDQAILLFMNENFSEALDTVEVLLSKGYSLPENLINMLEVNDDPRFLEIKQKNMKLFKKAQNEAKLKYNVCLPNDYDEKKKYPVFFNVHGDGMDGNIKDQMRNWPPETLLEKGYIVVYPQSSQTYCTNGYGWMQDKELSRKEIKICYEEICEKYSVDKTQVILAGFSGGADAVVDFSMHQVFPVKGFISLCPTKFVKSFTNDQILAAKTNEIKGCILEGENDLVPIVKDLVDEVNEMGLGCQYIVNKDVGHWFPLDLKEKVNQILNFINE